jgi:hypothetical protein
MARYCQIHNLDVQVLEMVEETKWILIKQLVDNGLINSMHGNLSRIRR